MFPLRCAGACSLVASGMARYAEIKAKGDDADFRDTANKEAVAEIFAKA